MSKAIRWQVQFSTNNAQAQQKYRIDIYDEDDGSWSGITQLQAGEVPFTTDEDSSEDYFAPIRPQTGTIEICTLMPGTSDQYITLDELLPDNNIARPVMVWNITNQSVLFHRIEWQGFLSCEAYSQDYIGTPQNLQLPVISVLEAMASVPLDQTRSTGLVTVRKAMYNALNEINVQTGMSFYSNVHFSMTSWRIFNKRINQTVFFDTKEYNTGNQTYYVVNGISAQEAIERICTFMGWVAREQGTEIYFEYIGEPLGMYSETFSDFGSDMQPINPPYTRVLQREMEDLDWMGTDHKQTVKQGAKSVEVVAKLNRDSFSLKLPGFPIGDTSNVEWVSAKYKDRSNFKYFYSQLNYNNEAYNNISYGYYAGSIERSGDYDYNATFLGVSTKTDFLNRLTLFPHASGNKYIGANPQIAGAILIRYDIQDDETNTHDFSSGLYCPLLPGNENHDAPIFKMWTLKTYTFFGGSFKIKADMLFNALYRYNSDNQQIMSDDVGDDYVKCVLNQMNMALKVGDMYYTGGQWTQTRGCFPVLLNGHGIEMLVPVNINLTGPVTLEIWAGITVGPNINTLYEVIFKSLEVTFEFSPNYQSTERGENRYIQLLNTNFRDELKIETDLATNQKNKVSLSLVMNSATEPMETMDYDVEEGGSIIQEARRPEIDLLNRMADFYSKARRRVDLVAKHPTNQNAPEPLPLIQMDGIDDGKKYLPLSESRNWQTDECTLTCFETPAETPSES